MSHPIPQQVEEKTQEFINTYNWEALFPPSTREKVTNHLRQALLSVYNSGTEDAVKIIKKWKNEGEDPTETDLVLENILKALSAPSSEDNA